MIKYFFVVLSCFLLISCSAFEHDDMTIPVDSEGNPSITGTSGTYEGVYDGTVKLVSNDCSNAGASVSMPTEITADILQSGDIISVQFDDEQDVTGKLQDNSAVLVLKESNLTKIYRLNFNEDGITGTCEISESTASGELGNTCASYDVELTPSAE